MSHFLVDTNIWSETLRRAPAPKVVTWLRTHERELFMSSITAGEIKHGIDLLPHGKRRLEYQKWLTELLNRMEGRVLSFNTSVAVVWGQLLASCNSQGKQLPTVDSQLAATAKKHSLKLATRNVRDFKGMGVKLADPFA